MMAGPPASSWILALKPPDSEVVSLSAVGATDYKLSLGNV